MILGIITSCLLVIWHFKIIFKNVYNEIRLYHIKHFNPFEKL